MRVVIFTPAPLLLSGVRLNDDGSVKSGRVVNGGWNFELRDGEMLCKSGNAIVTRYPAEPSMRVVDIPADMRDDYNKIVEWAKGQPVTREATAQ